MTVTYKEKHSNESGILSAALNHFSLIRPANFQQPFVRRHFTYGHKEEFRARPTVDPEMLNTPKPRPPGQMSRDAFWPTDPRQEPTVVRPFCGGNASYKYRRKWCTGLGDLLYARMCGEKCFSRRKARYRLRVYVARVANFGGT